MQQNAVRSGENEKDLLLSGSCRGRKGARLGGKIKGYLGDRWDSRPIG